jgi:SAM-dependent methyltransferase
MGLNYDHIAPGYDDYRRGRGPYFDSLLALARKAPGQRFLELGAGTGNNTQALTEEHACQLTALDPSKGMITRGRSKNLPAAWTQGSAVELPFNQNSFDFIFGTYMLHHILDLDTLFKECHRVLEQGIVAIVTVSQDFIQCHPMNHYFPSFAKIDLARFQPAEAIERAMNKAGFSEVSSLNLVDTPRPIDDSYAKKIEGKFISTYDLIPPDEFRRGLAQLKEDIRRENLSTSTIAREAVLFRGHKTTHP